MDEKAREIIESESLGIQCAPFKDEEETFCIVEDWRDVERLVSEYNNIDHIVPDGDIRTDSVSGEFLGDLHEKGDWDNTPPFIVPEGMREIGEILDTGWGFGDEYGFCTDTGEVVRTSPDDFGWTPDYWLTDDGELLCKFNKKDYVKACKNRLKNCNLVNPEDYGYAEIEKEFSTGLYEYANDDPKKLLNELNNEGIDVVFQIYPSPYTQDWSVYVPKNKKKEAEDLIDRINHKYAPGKSPADLAKKFLEDAPRAVSELQAREGGIMEGVIYVEPTKEGKAKARHVPRKEWIRGIGKKNGN